MKRKQSGVTLMELLTVVAVIGILASVALPSYRRYLQRAQRTDATSALLRVQTAEEKRYLQLGSYTTNLTAAPPTGLGLLATSERGYYNLSVATTTTGYTVTATPVSGGGQADDKSCGTFTINESGTRTALNTSGADNKTECWR
jgi:type IV pilus assembly protein PilE